MSTGVLEKEKREETIKTRNEKGIAPRWPFFETFGPATPLAFMRRFNDEAEKLFTEFFGMPRRFFGTAGAETPWLTTTWLPPLEVFEKDGFYVVRAELPGLTKNEVRVEVTDEYVVLQGERKREKEETKEGVFRTERTYGHFYRAIPLSAGVKPEQATAVFKNGMLEIKMPVLKREEKKTRKLEIKDAA